MAADKFPSLPKSYKRTFPFRLATTSFIYPADYLQNVKMLGPYFDEIELLLFESDNLPSKNTIKKLGILAKDMDLSYNIHLPTDISPGHPDPAIRRKASEVIIKTLDLTAPLEPTTLTIHLPFDAKSGEEEGIKKWKADTLETMAGVIDTGIDGRLFSAETLFYPPAWIDPIVFELNMSICLDMGHLILSGFSIEKIFKKYSEITSIIHLHGVKASKDHLALNELPMEIWKKISSFIKNFQKTISIEVFSFQDLVPSLVFLQKTIDDKV